MKIRTLLTPNETEILNVMGYEEVNTFFDLVGEIEKFKQVERLNVEVINKRCRQKPAVYFNNLSSPIMMKYFNDKDEPIENLFDCLVWCIENLKGGDK